MDNELDKKLMVQMNINCYKMYIGVLECLLREAVLVMEKPKSRWLTESSIARYRLNEKMGYYINDILYYDIMDLRSNSRVIEHCILAEDLILLHRAITDLLSQGRMTEQMMRDILLEIKDAFSRCPEIEYTILEPVLYTFLFGYV